MKKVSESAENYLETILVLSKRKGSVRSIDIANELDFSKPSVISEDGVLSLTESGRRIAEGIYERHLVLTRFFTSLGVDEDIAQADACKIEHILNPQTFNAIKRSLKDR